MIFALFVFSVLLVLLDLDDRVVLSDCYYAQIIHKGFFDLFVALFG